MYDAHDALLCVASGSYISQSDRRRSNPEYYFKSAEQMEALFEDIPEALHNTVAIAQRCSFLLTAIDPILPRFPIPEGETEAEELTRQASLGLEIRLERSVYPKDADEATKKALAQPYWDRLHFELDVITQMKFPGYFLIVADFIQWSKQNKIPVGPGRGSGAGSLVAWSLTITDLDPLRFGLLFERFLNPERVSMPDFDIDFCQDRRDEVISYVQNRYGTDRVAQIITFGKLQARIVLRDVGRVLEMAYSQVDRICKLIPNNPTAPVTLQQAIDGEPLLQEMIREDEKVAELTRIGLCLEGLYRHASTHAAGVVIGNKSLNEMVPLYKDPKSAIWVTQFNMKFVEQAGLVKFDFLGLKTLTVLQHAVELIAKTGPQIDLAYLPLDDAPTYELLSKGETMGVFQLEGSGMRDTLKKVKPNRFDDIIALVSLYRPGPMDNIPKYVAVKNGEEAPDYLHPSLEGILKETYGIMIYQEQVMQIAQTLSGYSLGSADLLRRAMGKKIQSEMDAQRKMFVDGATDNGVDARQAGEIFDQVSKFAGYGFNKSHAAAYALIAYQTAYLKANYPVEFLTASMSADLTNTDKLALFKAELKRLNIPLLPPDVQASYANFAVETLPNGTKAIRYALGAIKGVGEAAMEQLVKSRIETGPFEDIFDFVSRFGARTMSKKQLDALIQAGAFDLINANRAQLFHAVEILLRYAHQFQDDQSTGQGGLFTFAMATTQDRPILPEHEAWNTLIQLKHEFDVIGFYLSAHPLDSYTQVFEQLELTKSEDLTPSVEAGQVTLKMAGIVTDFQQRTSKKGNKFAFLQLSDSWGSFECLLFSETLNQYRPLLEVGQRLLLVLEAQKTGDEIRLLCQRIHLLDQAAQGLYDELHITMEHVKALDALKDILSKASKGKGKITLFVPLTPQERAEIIVSSDIKITLPLIKAIEKVTGVSDAKGISI